MSANVANCASCAGHCRRAYRVALTVADVRTIAAGTRLRPGEFTTVWPRAEGADGFQLVPDGPTMEPAWNAAVGSDGRDRTPDELDDFVLAA